MDADDAPPVVRGLAVIDDGGFVTMGEGGNEIESKTILIIISRIYMNNSKNYHAILIIHIFFH